jgi:hypothetical protein
VGTESVNNDDKNKTVRRSHQWNSGCWYRLRIMCWG